MRAKVIPTARIDLEHRSLLEHTKNFSMDPSTAVSSSPRNDDTIVSNIISLLTSDPYEDTDDVSSETKAWKERVIARARLALSDATIDRDDLHHQSKMLTHTIGLERELNTKNESLQGYQYLADVADWTAGILNIAKNMEGNAKVDHKRQLQSYLKATGVSAHDASKKIGSFEQWSILKGLFATDTWVILERELECIRSWSLGGRQAGKEPETPGLTDTVILTRTPLTPELRRDEHRIDESYHQDRIQHVAVKLSIPRQNLINAIHVYSDRNKALHAPPPIMMENLKADGKYDWDSIRKQCEEKKKTVDADVLAGRITEEQRDQFHVFIDDWFTLHLGGGDTPTVAAIQDRDAKKSKSLLSPMPSFYSDGKWDDIDL